MRGEPYTPCRLFYDGMQPIEVGDYLRTPAGSAYLITEIKPHRTRAYRHNLKCLRWPTSEIPAEATVHPLYWYRRQARRGRRLRELQ